jgi:hypothetical protein
MGNPSHKNDVGRETRMKKQSQTWAERGEQSFRGGEFKSAALAFRVALLQAPATYYLMVMFARSLVKVNPHSPFRHYAAKATVLVPSEPDAWLILADGAFGQRELRRAANAARRHMVLAPDDPNGGLSLSRVRFHRGELEQCLSGLTRTEALAPKNKVVVWPRLDACFVWADTMRRSRRATPPMKWAPLCVSSVSSIAGSPARPIDRIYLGNGCNGFWRSIIRSRIGVKFST